MIDKLSDFEVKVLRALAGTKRSVPWHKLARKVGVAVGLTTFIELDDRTDRLRRLGLIERSGFGKSSRYKLSGNGREVAGDL